MMNPESQVINRRFFQAIYELVKRKQLQSKKSFVTRYGLNLSNLYQLRRYPEKDFRLCYLTWLVRDFGVSSQWLLTGAFISKIGLKPPTMKYILVLLLFSFSFLFVTCKKSKEVVNPTQPPPKQSTDYFVKVTADGVEYKFNVAKYVYPVLPSDQYFHVGADSSDFAQQVEFITAAPLTGKPESIPIRAGRFSISKSVIYETRADLVNGLCTITKIDDKIAEGTFYFDVYRGTFKTTLNNGSFRLKITR